jgi:hypothetical protein
MPYLWYFSFMRIIEAGPGQETTYEEVSSTGEVTPIGLPERLKDYDGDVSQLFLHALVGADEYLDYIVSSEHIEDVGAYVHELWRSTKRAAQNDPNNPYIGYGPTRVKVADLDQAARKSLGIAEDASLDADIYHPLDRSYEELDSDTRNKNAVPVIVLCNFLGDIILDGQATLIDLENEINGLLQGEDPEKFELLKKIHHIAFLAGEARMNSRGYGDQRRSDFGLFKLLPTPVQELDGTTILPVADWMMRELQKEGETPEVTLSNESAKDANVDDIALALFWLINNEPDIARKEDEEFFKISGHYIRDVTLDDCTDTRVALVRDLLLDAQLVERAETGELRITDQGRIKEYQLDVANTLAKSQEGFSHTILRKFLIEKQKILL